MVAAIHARLTKDLFPREKEHEYLRVLDEMESFIADLYRACSQSSPLSEIGSIEPSGMELSPFHILSSNTISHLPFCHLQCMNIMFL